LLPSWKVIGDIISKFGMVKGIFIIFFFLAHFWLWRLYIDRVKDRKEEIDRLAQDNREYRDRFLLFIDNNIGHKKNPGRKE